MNWFNQMFSSKKRDEEDGIAVKKECPHKNRTYIKKAMYNSWPANYYVCHDCGKEGVDCTRKWF